MKLLNEALEIRTLLHCRQTLIREKTHILNSIRGHLKVYGIKLVRGRKKDFEQILEEKMASQTERIKTSIRRLLRVLEKLDQELEQFDREIKAIAKEDADIKLLKSIDGVGDITALAFKAEIDDPKRFSDSKDVGAYLGLTPTQYSSGETKRQGHISKRGSKEVRYLLIEAATVLLSRCQLWSKHKAWAVKLAKKKGMKKAQVALARKLAVTMHRMLISKKEFKRGVSKTQKKAA
jgi:transposase